ncbi:putative pectate lyase D [Paramyrothecium foliicola]|nr:putative pectate lyase D [Paramyrothecium foliicola]
MQYRMILMTTVALGTTAYASPARPQITLAPRAEHLRAKRQQPDGGASSVLDAPMTIAAGDSFDGGNAVFDRGASCSGQSEGGSSDAVFILEAGASLSNVVIGKSHSIRFFWAQANDEKIGPNQVEGVHCMGGCTLTNVWWDAVCEDAFSIKEQADGETTTINGGGAKGAQDKVIQHNGGGTVVINDFTVSDFGKLYRSCGNCDEMPARHVKVSGGSATNGDMLVGINSNMGDTASISGVSISGVESECTDFEGVTGGGEPSEIGPCSGVGSGGSPTTPGAGSPVTTPNPGTGGGSGGGSGSGDDEDTGSGDDSGSGSGGDSGSGSGGDDSGSGSGDNNGDDSGSGSGDDSGSGSGDDSGSGSGGDSGSGSGDDSGSGSGDDNGGDSGSGSGDDSGSGSGDNNDDSGSGSGGDNNDDSGSGSGDNGDDSGSGSGDNGDEGSDSGSGDSKDKEESSGDKDSKDDSSDSKDKDEGN